MILYEFAAFNVVTNAWVCKYYRNWFLNKYVVNIHRMNTSKKDAGSAVNASHVMTI